MSTVRDMIKGSLRLIGAIATGETPSADELNDCLLSLNRMLGVWSNETLILFDKIREVFPLTPGQQVYTMGIGGDFDTDRAQYIEVVKLLNTTVSPSIELPVDIINLEQWAAITLKSTPSSLPLKIYVEDAYPLALVNVWPVPSTANSLIFYSTKALSSFASINSVVSLPPGYDDAIIANLALRLAPEYGKQPDTAVVAMAVDGKETIKRKNIKPSYLSCDAGILARRSTFNWLAGE